MAILQFEKCLTAEGALVVLSPKMGSRVRVSELYCQT
jgi:hypothetical protein